MFIETRWPNNDALTGEQYVNRHSTSSRGTVDWSLAISRIATNSLCDRLALKSLDKENRDITDPFIAVADRFRQLAIMM